MLLAGISLAQPPASLGNDWVGSVRCDIKATAPGYLHEERQTWTLTGAPTVQGSMLVFPTTWTVTGQGTHDRTRYTNRRVAQWTAAVPGANPPVSAPIAFSVAPVTGIVNAQLWHSQLTRQGGYTGTDQYINDGVAQPPGRLVATLYELQFPRITGEPKSTRFSGYANYEVKAQVGPLQPLAESQVNIACVWELGRGTVNPLPPSTTPEVPSSGSTSSNTPPANTPGSTTPGGTTTPPASTTAKLLSVSPASFEQGALGTVVTLAGASTHWNAGAATITVEPGIGVPITNSQATSDTELLVQLDIQYAAAPGPRTMTVKVGNELVTLPNAFTVTPRAQPSLLSVSPNTGTQGDQNLTLRFTGKDTKWAQGKTTVTIGLPFDASNPNAQIPPQYVTVQSLTINSPTSATAVVNIAAAATAGKYWISVWDPAPSDWLKIVDGFTVTAAPTSSSGNTGTTPGTSPGTTPGTPPAGGTGAAATIRVTAQPGTWRRGGTHTATWTHNLTNPGPFNLMLEYTLQDNSKANVAWCYTTNSASPGSCTAADQVFPFPSPAKSVRARLFYQNVDYFSDSVPVSPEVVSIARVNPNSGRIGETIDVEVTGQFTEFVAGTTYASFGPDMSAQVIRVNSPTSAVVRVALYENTATGPKYVNMITGTQSIKAENAFTVNPAATTPSASTPAPGFGGAATGPEGATLWVRKWANATGGSPQSVTVEASHTSGGTSQWWKIAADDMPGATAPLLQFSATVSGGPSDRTYQVDLVEETPTGRVNRSLSPISNTPVSSLYWSNVAGTDDTKILFVVVRHVTGAATSAKYTLTLNWGGSVQTAGSAPPSGSPGTPAATSPSRATSPNAFPTSSTGGGLTALPTSTPSTTPPTPVDPSNFTATQTADGTVRLTWSAVTGAGSYIVGGPGTNNGATVNGTSHTVTNIAPGTYTWTVATVYNPGGVLTTADKWSKATATVVNRSARYRILINGFRVNSESNAGPFFEHNAVYAAAEVEVLNRQGNFSVMRNPAIVRSLVHGDNSKDASRVRAGSASTSGGFVAGDLYPTGQNPAAVTSAPSTTTFPLQLWEGPLTDGVEAVVVRPTLWVWNSRPNTFNYWERTSKSEFGIAAAGNVRALEMDQVRDRASRSDMSPFRLASPRMFTCISDTIVILDFAQCIPNHDDRPIGLSPDPGGSGYNVWLDLVVVITREAIENALASATQVGGVPNGVIAINLRDNGSNWGANYDLYLRVQRVP